MYSPPKNKTHQNLEYWVVTGTETDKTQGREFPAHILTIVAAHTGTEALLKEEKGLVSPSLILLITGSSVYPDATGRHEIDGVLPYNNLQHRVSVRYLGKGVRVH